MHVPCATLSFPHKKMEEIFKLLFELRTCQSNIVESCSNSDCTAKSQKAQKRDSGIYQDDQQQRATLQWPNGSSQIVTCFFETKFCFLNYVITNILSKFRICLEILRMSFFLFVCLIFKKGIQITL